MDTFKLLSNNQWFPFLKGITCKFPIIHRVEPRLLSSDLVSVQPMSMPVMTLFFMGRGYPQTSKPKVFKLLSGYN